MASDGLDVLQFAADELTGQAIPDPEMLLSELGPFALVYYCHQVTDFALRKLTALVVADDEGELTGTDGPVVAMVGVSTALGNLTAAGIALGLFDDEEVPT